MTTKVRPTQELHSLDSIIDVLTAAMYPELVWVGKQYSKADLIRDLKKLKGTLSNG